MASKPKYAGLGILLGAVLGAVAAIFLGSGGLWLAIGIVLGITVGAWWFRRNPGDDVDMKRLKADG